MDVLQNAAKKHLIFHYIFVQLWLGQSERTVYMHFFILDNVLIILV